MLGSGQTDSENQHPFHPMVAANVLALAPYIMAFETPELYRQSSLNDSFTQLTQTLCPLLGLIHFEPDKLEEIHKKWQGSQKNEMNSQHNVVLQLPVSDVNLYHAIRSFLHTIQPQNKKTEQETLSHLWASLIKYTIQHTDYSMLSNHAKHAYFFVQAWLQQEITSQLLPDVIILHDSQQKTAPAHMNLIYEKDKIKVYTSDKSFAEKANRIYQTAIAFLVRVNQTELAQILHNAIYIGKQGINNKAFNTDQNIAMFFSPSVIQCLGLNQKIFSEDTRFPENYFVQLPPTITDFIRGEYYFLPSVLQYVINSEAYNKPFHLSQEQYLSTNLGQQLLTDFQSRDIKPERNPYMSINALVQGKEELASDQTPETSPKSRKGSGEKKGFFRNLKRTISGEKDNKLRKSVSGEKDNKLNRSESCYDLVTDERGHKKKFNSSENEFDVNKTYIGPPRSPRALLIKPNTKRGRKPSISAKDDSGTDNGSKPKKPIAPKNSAPLLQAYNKGATASSDDPNTTPVSQSPVDDSENERVIRALDSFAAFKLHDPAYHDPIERRKEKHKQDSGRSALTPRKP